MGDAALSFVLAVARLAPLRRLIESLLLEILLRRNRENKLFAAVDADEYLVLTLFYTHTSPCASNHVCFSLYNRDKVCHDPFERVGAAPCASQSSSSRMIANRLPQ